MIDVHCHILPALDDGARDLDDSIAMAHQAVDDGIAVVCATPHIRPDHNVAIAELSGRRTALQVELDRRGTSVEIAAGGEVSQLSALTLSDAELGAVSLGGGGWLLLEPAPGALDDSLAETVEQLHGRGWRSLIAHPERHAGPGFEPRLRELAQIGALIQWTAEFIASAAGGEIALECARAGLVHVLGSDAHSAIFGRRVQLSDGVARLRDVCSSAQLDWIVRRAPEAILTGAEVEPYPLPHDDS